MNPRCLMRLTTIAYALNKYPPRRKEFSSSYSPCSLDQVQTESVHVIVSAPHARFDIARTHFVNN